MTRVKISLRGRKGTEQLIFLQVTVHYALICVLRDIRIANAKLSNATILKFRITMTRNYDGENTMTICERLNNKGPRWRYTTDRSTMWHIKVASKKKRDSVRNLEEIAWCNNCPVGVSRIEFEYYNTSVAHYGNYCYRFYSLLLFLLGRELPRGFHSCPRDSKSSSRSILSSPFPFRLCTTTC